MHKSAHVLIIDDEPDTVEILSRQLAIENYKVFKCYSGKESLELLKKHKLDLILMDIMMPVMDGFETIRIIRDTVKDFIPIIIVTATRDDTESIARGFAVGADDYIVIPCHKEELLARVKAMLRIKVLHDEIAERNQELTEAYEKIKETQKTLAAAALSDRKKTFELEKACKKLEESQADLIQSEKLAVMGRLTADVSHELNNPLSIIIGELQFMLTQLDKKQAPFKNPLEVVLRNARRCKTILSNLLGYGRTIGKSEEAVNVSDLIREAIDAVRCQYNMRAIKVVLNCNAPADAEIIGNRAALLSVFVNLVRNARQAMGRKGRLIIIIEKEDKKHLRIEIRDTGVGMSTEQRARLFRPFTSGWKVAASARKAQGGRLPLCGDMESIGLGLATSLGIIETHRGRMSAESEGVGKGATFTVLVPYKLKRRSEGGALKKYTNNGEIKNE